MVREIFCLLILAVASVVCGPVFGQVGVSDPGEELLELPSGSLLEPEYTNQWAVRIDGGPTVAQRVADELGYQFIRQVGALDDHYLLSRSDHPHRAKREAHHHTRALFEDSRVQWVEQQVARMRVKRDIISKRDERRAYETTRFQDSYWKDQWYLHNPTTDRRAAPHLDLHVVPVWAKNITGHGVVVTVLDDGIEHNHTDIAQNYDPKASYDLNDDDDDPFPRYDRTNENKHGTRCAGEIAMVANNGKCGVGIAYNARIGGIRMLDGRVTDSLEAEALTFNHNYVDIYSASWGPNDDGSTVEGPGTMASAAFEKGITEGRGGKGVIYVWASGNGGGHDDNCDCDGYTASIYTVSVSSASEQLQSPWYAEKCASTIATTYSSGEVGDHKIISTDLHDKCTDSHTGTSASAPLAAGIFALLLEANPEVTWRDLQHLVVWTSDYLALKDNVGWKRNGAGFWVNSRFGFGLLNAGKLVNVADPKTFHTVPEKTICTVDVGSSELPRQLSSGEEIVINIESTGCQGEDAEMNYLEHVQLKVDLNHTSRGDLEIYLTSSMNTETMLLSRRGSDVSDKGFQDWPFMSVHTWGENPRGGWVVKIIDTSESGNVGEVNSVSLVLHGTKAIPDHVRRAGGRRNYGKTLDIEQPAITDTNPVLPAETQDDYEANLIESMEENALQRNLGEYLVANRNSDDPLYNEIDQGQYQAADDTYKAREEEEYYLPLAAKYYNIRDDEFFQRAGQYESPYGSPDGDVYLVDGLPPVQEEEEERQRWERNDELAEPLLSDYPRYNRYPKYRNANY